MLSSDVEWCNEGNQPKTLLSAETGSLAQVTSRCDSSIGMITNHYLHRHLQTFDFAGQLDIYIVQIIGTCELSTGYNKNSEGVCPKLQL